MRPRPSLPESIEDLLANRYGRPDPKLLRHTDDVDALLDGWFGKLPPRRRPQAAGQSLSVQHDSGMVVLDQRVVQRARSPSGAAETAPDGPHPRIGPLDFPADPVPTLPQPASDPPQAEPVAAAPAREPAPPASRPAAAGPAPEPAAAGPAQAAVTPMSMPEVAGAQSSEDDFLADMQSIFNGNGVYDPAQKRVVDRKEARAAEDKAAVAPPTPESNPQAIFDRIAQSMQYAGAYDLGTVELQNRFDAFDREDETERRAKADQLNRKRAQPGAPAPDLMVDSDDFINDLDAIQKQAVAAVPDTGKPGVSEASSVPRRYSAPLYDTGEHVMAGAGLYVDQLLVGKSPGVPFSYGDIIAMADLFSIVDEMMSKDTAELQALKTLIRRSAAYYGSKRAPSIRDVSTKEWEQATNGRYLKLAEDNYDHFGPNLLFSGAATPMRQGNHRQAWAIHHERAINAARAMALDPANANVSYVPYWPLIINAFGDHFLTDAFAAGHLINKGEVQDRFKSKFFNGDKLTKAGNEFFERVAAKAWKQGDVAAKFKKLETVKPRLWVWHPDINNAGRLASVLQGVAEAAPEKVSNVVVKAIHDWLNKNGIEVVNKAGHAPWRLTGDGYLTEETLAIMRQAVAQSAGTITDPAILVSAPASDFFARTWNFVPVLTPASEATVRTLADGLVDPSSAALANAAADIITGEVDSLIAALIDNKALQPN